MHAHIRSTKGQARPGKVSHQASVQCDAGTGSRPQRSCAPTSDSLSSLVMRLGIKEVVTAAAAND